MNTVDRLYAAVAAARPGGFVQEAYLSGDTHADYLPRLMGVVPRLTGYRAEERPLRREDGLVDPSASGYADHNLRLVVAFTGPDKGPVNHRLRVMFHEVAHALQRRDNSRFGAPRIDECTAEATAALVCEGLNLPAVEKSALYIRQWVSLAEPEWHAREWVPVVEGWAEEIRSALDKPPPPLYPSVSDPFSPSRRLY